jgi:hypothetical protein
VGREAVAMAFTEADVEAAVTVALYYLIFQYICNLYDAMFMFYNDSGDFLNNPPSFGYNSGISENIFFSVLDFSGALGLQKGQGQRARFRTFETNAMG